MKLAFALFVIILFILSSCSGGGGGGGGGAATSNPWRNIQEDTVDHADITDEERELVFSDGITIAYRSDSSSENLTSNDEICRKEEKNGETLEICLDLTTSLENSLLSVSGGLSSIDGPLVLAFSSDAGISCYVDGTNVICETLYQKVSGSENQFSCKSKLLNGDKSLSCSDNWAVVVNGEEDDEHRAICRVSISNNSGRCLVAPSDKVDEDGEEKPAEDLVKEMQNTSWDGYLNKKEGIINYKQILFDTGADMRLKAEALENTPKTRANIGIDVPLKLNYKSLDTSICTVDNDNDEDNGEKGTIEIIDRGECKIVLKVKARGFIDRVIHAIIEAVDSNDATWDGYENSIFYVGEVRDALDIENISSPTPIYKSKTINVCKVDGNGAVEAISQGECTIDLLIKKQGLLDKLISKSITVSPLINQEDEGTIDFNPDLVGVVGEDLVLNAVTGAHASAEIKYIVVNQGNTGCAFKGTTGNNQRTLIFTNSGTCKIKATANRGRGYKVWDSGEKSIIVSKGTLDITWGSFTGTLEVGGESKLPTTPTGSDVSDSTITYELKSGSEVNCELLSPQMGKVRAKAVNLSTTKKCILEATATRVGYNDKTADIEIILSAGTLGDITWGSFTGTLEVGGATKTPSAPSGSGALGATLSYKIKTTSQANCQLVDATTGEVKAKAIDLSTTKKCILEATAVNTGYSSSTDIEIILSAGTLGDITWGSFTDTLEVGGATKTPSASTGAGATGSSITYAIKSGYGANCELVSAAIGEVRAKAVNLSTTKKCILEATATRVGYNDKTADIEIILSAGTLGDITWGSFTGTLEVGGATKTPSASTGAGATGSSITYAIKSGYGANCELVSAAIGEVRAKAVNLSTTKKCILEATATRIGYNNKVSDDIEISLLAGTILLTGNLEYRGILAVSGSVIVQNPVATPLAVNWSYDVVGKRSGVVVDGICSIDDTTGELGATSSSIANDVCEVTAKASSLGYISKSISVVVTISNLQPLGLTWAGYIYSGSSNVAVFGATAPTLQTPVSNPNGADFAYSIDDLLTTNDSCTIDESTGALTIKAAGNCSVVVTASNVPGRTTAVATVTVVIAKASQTLTWPSNPYGSSPVLKVGKKLQITTAPSGGKGDVEYKSITTSICSVDEDSGEITPLDIGTCKIQASFLGDANHESSAYVTGLTSTVSKGDIVTTSFGSYDAVYVGDTTSAPSVTGLTPAAASKAYSTTSDDCSVDEDSGEVTGIKDGSGNCEILLTLSLDKYNDFEHTYTISVLKGNIGVLTAPVYASTNLKIGGTNAPLQAAPSGAVAGSVWSYRVQGYRGVATQAGVCSVVASSGLVSLAASAQIGDTCKLIASATKEGYNTKDTSEIVFSVIAGDITVSDWGSYQDIVVGKPPVSAPTITRTPADTSAEYQTTASSSGCSVTSSGLVTGANNGTNNCEIKVTLTKIGYSSESYTYLISILPGTLGAVTAPIYNSELVISETAIAFDTAPTGDAEVSFVYSATGKRASVVTSNVCSVDNSGKVKTLNGAIPGDVCEITTTARKEGYTDKQAPVVSLTIKGQISMTWNGYNPGTFSFNQTSVLISPNITPVGTNLVYSISSSTPSGICNVSSSTGLLSITGAGSCVVKLTASKVNYINNSKTFTVTINKANQPAPTITGNAYNIVGGRQYKEGDKLTLNTASISLGHGDLSVRTTNTSICSIIDTSTKKLLLKNKGTCRACFKHAGNDNYEPSPETCSDIVSFVDGAIIVRDWGRYPDLIKGTRNSADAPSIVFDTHSSLINGNFYSNVSGSRGCTRDNNGRVSIDTNNPVYGFGVCKVKLSYLSNNLSSAYHIYAISIFNNDGTIYVNNWGNYSSIKYGESIEAPEIRTYPEDTTKSYTLGSGSVGCSVVQSTGEVTATAATSGTDKCKVKLTVSKNGYTAKTHTYQFSIAKADIPETATFTAPQYTIRIALSNTQYPSFNINSQPSITGIDDANLAAFSYQDPNKTFRNGVLHPYSVHNIGCYDINSNTGTIRIRGSTGIHNVTRAYHGDECYFNAIVNHPNYNTKKFEFKIKILGKKIDFTDLEFTEKGIALGGYPKLQAMSLGDTMSYSGFYVPSGLSGQFKVTKSFSLDSTSTGCTLDANGSVTGVSAGVDTCIVNMTVDAWMKHYSKHPGFKNKVHWIDYEPRIYQFKFTMIASDQIYVRDWGSWPIIEAAFWVDDSPPNPVVIPSDVTKKYYIEGSGGGCRKHSNFRSNGRLSASENSIARCKVKLVLSKENRNSISHIYEVRNQAAVNADN